MGGGAPAPCALVPTVESVFGQTVLVASSGYQEDGVGRESGCWRGASPGRPKRSSLERWSSEWS